MNPNDPNLPHDYSAFRANVLKDTNDHFKAKYAPNATSPEAQLVSRAQQITLAIQRCVQPILAAGGASDMPNLRGIICQMYLEAFDKLSKDELVALLALLHTEIMSETIDHDRLGRGNQDLLS